ncbi:MAG: carbamoyltransferase family protein [Mycobacteriales bacterium]
MAGNRDADLAHTLTLPPSQEQMLVAILGLNCFSHDTAAALLVDGELVALGEQERFNRETHTKAFPDTAIEFCLKRAGLAICDLDAVAVAQRPLLDFARAELDALARVAPKRAAAQAYTDARLLSREARFRRRWGFRGRLTHVGHHEAHAASTFFASPFDEAAVLTLDRGGDFLSTTLGVGQGSRLQTLASVRNPHSLGELYSALTTFLGFQANSDEGKVMGLAPYGSDRFAHDLRRLVRLRCDGRFRIDLRYFGWQREAAAVSGRFTARYGPPRVPETELTARDKDLAYAIQDLLEAAALHVARGLRSRCGSANLCLSGGVALNSVMNQRLLDEAGFEQIFVQPAASDAGNALGAALWVWHQVMGRPRAWSMHHAYWGHVHSDTDYIQALDAAGLGYRRVSDPAATAAQLIADGRVVGWFQGRAEVGPRALGARSILADPRRAEMRDIVNDRVKRREWFRPFAPSVLHEHGAEYFDGYRLTPFMLLVQPVRADKRQAVPAITHVDGTARPQSVLAETNPLFHRLIDEFNRRTGVPLVLNTSFNLRGEPIVHSPADAIADYQRSAMDALFLGPYLACKQPTSASG